MIFFRGRALHDNLTADDYAHVIIACLLHDIGYVRGLFGDDDEDGFVVNQAGSKVILPRGSSDAGPHAPSCRPLEALRDAAGSRALRRLNRQRIADAIEGTRFSSATRPAMGPGGLDCSGSGFHRTARRSQLHPQSQRALP